MSILRRILIYLIFIALQRNSYSFDVFNLFESHKDLKIKLDKSPLKVFWNVPSFQCDPFGLNFSVLLEKYNITQNRNARFRGDTINILYDPGNFPAILNKGNQIFLRNGGVPQEGNLTSHKEIFSQIVEQLITNHNFSGPAVIDFESWRPIHKQNWLKLSAYVKLSEKIERQHHPLWPDSWITKEAVRRFENAARIFMEETLKLAKSLRRNAQWGYYHYPYCFNNDGNAKSCSKQVMDQNDKLGWLFENSDALYPSVYLQEAHSMKQRVRVIETSLDEALRVRNNTKNSEKKVYVYYWYKFQDTNNFLSKEDLFITLLTIAGYNIDGLIMWGSSADMSSKKKCFQFYDYVDNVLGPTIRFNSK